MTRLWGHRIPPDTRERAYYSGVVHAFARPWLERVPVEQHQLVGQVAVDIWNAVVMDSINECTRYVDKKFKKLEAIPEPWGPYIRWAARDMIKWKRHQFGGERWIITLWQIVYADDGALRLEVETSRNSGTMH